MLDMLMENTASENGTLIKYLEKEKKDAERELKKFKRQKEKEKEDRIREL